MILLPIVHFLNVKEGDCSIIQHGSGHVSVIDVCNARKEKDLATLLYEVLGGNRQKLSGSGNLNQKSYPVNPISYLKSFNITSIFRFVVTHPDMDHIDGIKDLFEEFNPVNFYDTDNNKEVDFQEGSPYRKEDWEFYKALRDNNPQSDPKRLLIFSGDSGSYRTLDWEGNPPGDAFYVLAPTKSLVEEANKSGDFNDCSYVILYHGAGGKVLFSGDAHDKTWEHILSNHASKVQNIDLLIAPHHGRKSNRNYSFLDHLNPKMTFFGNARSEHIAYSAWSYRQLPYITNNQANCMIVDAGNNNMPIYVTNHTFALQQNPYTFYSDVFKGWYLTNIK